MSNRFLAYLQREHTRLENAIANRLKSPRPDDMEIARLKKLKLMVKDQLASWSVECPENRDEHPSYYSKK